MVFKGEKSLRTNEARYGELAALEIAAIQRNGESIGMRAARDLAQNQIRAWKIDNHQSRSALFDGQIGLPKRNDNDFAGYRFDHAASSSGEFQSRARTDSLSSAPLNDSSRAFFGSTEFDPRSPDRSPATLAGVTVDVALLPAGSVRPTVCRLCFSISAAETAATTTRPLLSIDSRVLMDAT